MSNGREWTADDRSELRRLVASGLNDSQIGERMNRHRVAVAKKRKEMQLQPGIPARLRAMMNRINMRRRAMARA